MTKGASASLPSNSIFDHLVCQELFKFTVQGASHCDRAHPVLWTHREVHRCGRFYFQKLLIASSRKTFATSFHAPVDHRLENRSHDQELALQITLRIQPSPRRLTSGRNSAQHYEDVTFRNITSQVLQRHHQYNAVFGVFRSSRHGLAQRTTSPILSSFDRDGLYFQQAHIRYSVDVRYS